MVGVLAALAVLAAAGYWQREPIRRFVSETVGTAIRHRFIAFTSLLTYQPRDTADMAPVRHGDVNPYAINVFLEQEVDEVKIRRTLEMVRAAGFTTIKQQVLWSEIETPRKGQYGDTFDTWAKYDRLVALAHEYGLALILRVDTSPQWARRFSPKIETPPDDFQDYGDFLATLATRYRGKVRYYQIWNEPNLAFEWGDVGPDASEYSRLLRLSFVRLKRADPDCLVVAAALAPTLEESARGISDLRYLQGMYDAGARDYFDVMSTNAYGLRHSPDDYRLDQERDVNFARPVLVREVMVRNGDAEKPIWVAEVGWNALPADFGEEARYGIVSREQQAAYTVRAYQRAQEEWPWLGVMALWHFRMAHERDQTQQQYYFNTVDAGFVPYPVYTAMAEQARGAPAFYRGYYQEDNWRLSLPAGWAPRQDARASLGAYAATERGEGAALELRFVGTGLTLVTRKCPECGGLALAVDSQERAVGWQCDAGGSDPGDLSSPTDEWQARVPLVCNLPAGLHTVRLRPEPLRPRGEGGTLVVFDGFIVEGPTAQQTLYARLTTGGLAAGGVILAVVLAKWRRRWRLRWQ